MRRFVSDWLKVKFTDQRFRHPEPVEGSVQPELLPTAWKTSSHCSSGHSKGTYVHCAPFHLHRYLDEQAYRFNERSGNDSDRFMKAMRKTPKIKLTYRKLT